MGQLTSITETKLNYFDVPAGARTVLLSSYKIKAVVQDPDDVTQSILTYDKDDGTKPDVIRASGLPSQLTTAINTGSSAVKSISVTVIPIDGSASAVKKINPMYIYRVFEDPADSNKSYVLYKDTTMTGFDSYHCNNTVASILSDSNA